MDGGVLTGVLTVGGGECCGKSRNTCLFSAADFINPSLFLRFVVVRDCRLARVWTSWQEHPLRLSAGPDILRSCPKMVRCLGKSVAVNFVQLDLAVRSATGRMRWLDLVRSSFYRLFLSSSFLPSLAFFIHSAPSYSWLFRLFYCIIGRLLQSFEWERIQSGCCSKRWVRACIERQMLSHIAHYVSSVS
jgi:hypothetical protein